MALADRYIQSKEMATATETYYTRFSSGISQEQSMAWEREILTAEKKRSEKPSSMDVLGVRTNVRESDMPYSMSGTSPDTSLEAVISMAINIEEKQLAFTNYSNTRP